MQRTRSFYGIYVNGKLVNEKTGIALKLLDLFTYFRDFVYILLWTINARKNLVEKDV